MGVRSQVFPMSMYGGRPAVWAARQRRNSRPGLAPTLREVASGWRQKWGLVSEDTRIKNTSTGQIHKQAEGLRIKCG